MTWRENLSALIENGGLYAGFGGITALAKDLKVSRQTIYDWIAACNEPDVANRRKLAGLAGSAPAVTGID